MIEIDYLFKKYKDREILSIKNHSFQEGIHLLKGDNGIGKTTFLKCLFGLSECESRIKIDGINITNEKWKLNSGVFINNNYLLQFMTPTSFLKFASTLKNVPNFEKEILNFGDFLNFDLEDNIINDLSEGQKDKLGIVTALINNPRYLVLDEPFARLDEDSKTWLWSFLKKRYENNGFLIFSTHDFSFLSNKDETFLKIWYIESNSLKEKNEICN